MSGEGGRDRVRNPNDRDRRGREPRATTGRRVVDLLQYAVAVDLAVSLVLAVPSFLLGFGLVGVKYGLFVLGFLAFGYGAFLLQPAKPWKEEEGRGGREPTRFQAAVRRVPPAAWLPIEPRDRYGRGLKLFAASLLLLATSYVMETVFGVAA